MGWLQVSLDGVIIVCQALKKADVNAYLQAKAEDFIRAQARNITTTIIERIFLRRTPESKARRAITDEFEGIFKHRNFKALLDTVFDEVDQTVVVPLVEAIEEFAIIDDGNFYAMPKYVLRCNLHNTLYARIEAVNGLKNIWIDLHGDNEKMSARWDDIQSTFFDFVATTGTQQVLEGFDQVFVPHAKWTIFGRSIKIKTIHRQNDQDIYFWGVNSELRWRQKQIKGHYFFNKRASPPNVADFKRAKDLRRDLDAKLLSVDLTKFADAITAGINSGHAPSTIRELLSLRQS